MRKVRSAPQLAGMEAKIAAGSAVAVGSPRHLLAGAAAGVHGLQKKLTVMVRETSYVWCSHLEAPFAGVARSNLRHSCRLVLSKAPPRKLACDALPLLDTA